MRYKPSLIPLLFFFSLSSYAQQDHWDTYLAQYEKGVGSTLINMDAKKLAPVKDLPFLFSAGVKYNDCTAEGFPGAAEFSKLGVISDSIVALVNRHSRNKLVGTYTYQCVRRDYFYVPDTSGLRQKVIDLIYRSFPLYTPAFNIREDRNWEAYLGFLYPNEETIEYMKNQKVLLQLEQAGDKPGIARQVDHWLYFQTEKDRDCFVEYATGQRYIIESKEIVTNQGNPFSLHISRVDKVSLPEISRQTLELRRKARSCNGDYDGWETVVVK